MRRRRRPCMTSPRIVQRRPPSPPSYWSPRIAGGMPTVSHPDGTASCWRRKGPASAPPVFAMGLRGACLPSLVFLFQNGRFASQLAGNMLRKGWSHHGPSWSDSIPKVVTSPFVARVLGVLRDRCFMKLHTADEQLYAHQIAHVEPVVLHHVVKRKTSNNLVLAHRG